MWMGVIWREALISFLHKHSFCDAPTPKLGVKDSRPMASISIIKAMSANIKFMDVTNPTVTAPRGRVADKHSRLVLVTWATTGKFHQF